MTYSSSWLKFVGIEWQATATTFLESFFSLGEIAFPAIIFIYFYIYINWMQRRCVPSSSGGLIIAKHGRKDMQVAYCKARV